VHAAQTGASPYWSHSPIGIGFNRWIDFNPLSDPAHMSQQQAAWSGRTAGGALTQQQHKSKLKTCGDLAGISSENPCTVLH
jgi:hypothetical protein